MIDFEKVKSLARSGKKINAVKYVKDQSALGLKEAKELVEKLEEGLITPTQAHKYFYEDVAFDTYQKKQADLNKPLNEINDFVSSGKKLQAVKALKGLTKFGLRDCKNIVDALANKTLAPENLQKAINQITNQKQLVVDDTTTNSTTNNLIIKKKRNYSTYLIIILIIVVTLYFTFWR